MFLFRVKVEELDAVSLDALMADLHRNEDAIRAQCPIREMNLVAEGERKTTGNELDIYLALDDFVDGKQLRRLVGEINSVLDLEFPQNATSSATPRVSSELIHI